MRICLVTGELLGVVKNGGLGTATSYLALALASGGHDVELLNVGPERRISGEWDRKYHEHGVVVTVPPRIARVQPSFLATTARVLEYLRTQEPEIAIFQDWQGLGFASFRAKQLGLALQGSALGLYCHGSTDWVAEANRRFPTTLPELGYRAMERISAETADFVVSPSAYLIDWMRTQGWRLPARTRVIPYFSASTIEERSATALSPGSRPMEIVFFGRLEERKGIAVFVEALNQLDPDALAGRTLTFLGRQDTWSVGRIRRALDDRTRRSLHDLKFHTDLDHGEALATLERKGVLAVMPSLTDNSPCVLYECLERGVPFLTSARGGGSELIEEADRPGVLFEPTARDLSRALDDVLTGGRPPPRARPSFSADKLRTAWSDLLAETSSGSHHRARYVESPLVSVVVTHFERPELLEICLAGFRRQTYERLELIVVDDGSTSEKSAKTLDRIEAGRWPWPVHVIRQENRYLGAARNTGWRRANGELVVFFDDDDVPFDYFVDTLVHARISSDADVVTCGMRFLHQVDDRPDQRRAGVTWLYIGEPRELGVIENQYGGACSLWRRDLLTLLGGHHEEPGVAWEDWELLARASLAGAHIVSVPQALMWYRIAPNSMSRTKREFECRRVVTNAFASSMPAGLPLLPLISHLAYAYPGLPSSGTVGTLRTRFRGRLGHGRILVRRTREVAETEGFRAVAVKGAAWIRRGGRPAQP
jgi:GT2 family glycosyltransferase/glycosyltransferase involved in cell wall biosynthesis